MGRNRVLLIGGSGFLGGWIARQMVVRGIHVIVPSRRRDGCKWLSPWPVAEIVETDVHEPEALHSLMSGVDAVINLVGILHDRDSCEPFGRRFAEAHVELPRKIIAAMHQTGVRRLIHISALRAAANAPSAYLRSKAAGEAVVLSEGEVLEVTIFRPSVIFGANDVFLNTFAQLLKVFPILPLGGGSARFQPVFVGDVADVVTDALDNPETFGKTYELCGPKIYTLHELVDYTASQIGKRRIIVDMPGPLAYLQAVLLGMLPNPPMSPDNLRSMQLASVSDGQHDYPGWNPVALESVAPAYLARKQ